MRRDLALAFRIGGGGLLSLGFFLLAALLIPLGVGPEGQALARIAAGVVWVCALLACLLSLDRL
ncbi:MAG: heme exporter protein CcmB, partial [Albimonas sp.]|uniref:heme exporter protein CcmB n=1 Tax=Albimonas sp. TaxID=1872425 RepID=UPI004055B387